VWKHLSYERLAGLTLAAALTLAACAPAAQPAAEGGPLTEVGESEGSVSIVAWAGYIESGETDPNYDWVTDFEAESGCQVDVKVAATSDEMVALMTEGGFDLVTASGDASNRLISAGLVQEINTGLIPSYSTVDERLQNAPWHTVDTDGDGTAEHYGVPYQWGSNVLMYNTEVFTEPPTSWNVVFEEMTLGDGQSNKGRIEAYDGPIYIADAALYLQYHNPELGIKDPYELTREQFNAALDLLRQQRELVNPTGTTPSSRWMTSSTRAWWRPAPGRSRSTCCSSTANRSPASSRSREPPAGRTPP